MSTSSQDEKSLLEFLDSSQLNCLNEASDHTLKPILKDKVKNTSTNYLLSDADEQLLLSLHFNQAVRVRSLAITCSNEAEGPKKIKLFINRPSIGFEDAEDAEEPAAAQILELTKAQIVNGVNIPLRYVRFQSVNSLHVFVHSNQDDKDQTRIDAIEVFGTPNEATKDLSGLKKTED